MACQSTRSWEAAPAATAAVNCFASSISLPSALVTKDPMEVSPLAREAFGLYPSHYETAFACSIAPYPHACRLPLRVAFPPGRRVGLPRSVSIPLKGLGPACSPVVVLSRVRNERVAYTGPHAFWLKPISVVWLAGSHDVYQRCTYVSHVIPP